ncbi:MAG: hypothetical protein JKY01_02050 [Pseudomonadales bacterium]|nr:hypothetical protein [Pseudomonadales bacterium]
MHYKLSVRRLACLIIMTLLSLDVWAGRLYQYKDDEGKTVLNDRVPNAAIHKGYRVLNDKGYLIEVVPPAMTEEQKKRFHDEKRQQKVLKKLLKTYSSPEDAELARDRQLDMLDSQIGVKNGVIARLQGQMKRETEKAAGLERRGKKVHAVIVEKLERLDRQVDVAKQDIAKRELEKEGTRVRFEKDIQQLRKLLNKPAKSLKTKAAE